MKTMQKYKSIKHVRAERIDLMERPVCEDGDECPVTYLRLSNGTNVAVTSAWCVKHDVEVGGYYVIYENGYESFSPAGVFESCSTKIEEEDNESW